MNVLPLGVNFVLVPVPSYFIAELVRVLAGVRGAIGHFTWTETLIVDRVTD